MATTKLATREHQKQAAALIEKQLKDGEKVLNAPAPAGKQKVSPEAFKAAEALFRANQVGAGPRPKDASPEGIKELEAANLISVSGVRRGTKYVLLKRPENLIADTALATAPRKTRAPRGAVSGNRRGVLTIGERERDILRTGIQEYVRFATGAESRKHEEKRQSADVLDRIHTRAKELVAEARKDGRPLTPTDALHHAEAEMAQSFESLLQTKYDPIFYSIFAVFESGDESMKTAKS